MSEIRSFALTQTGELLDQFLLNASRAAESGSDEAIHDVRVSIRRLRRALSVFRPFLPPDASDEIGSATRRTLDLAAAVRDRDLAIEVARKSGLDVQGLVDALKVDRRHALQELRTELLSTPVLERWRGAFK